MKKKIFGISCLFLLLAAGYTAGQPAAKPGLPAGEPLLGRFGFRFSLDSWAGFDSNVLRLSNGTSDAFGRVFPSLFVEYPLSSATRLSAGYRLGLDRYSSTSLLNATSHRGVLELIHRFSPGWSIRVHGGLEKSDQPDLLTTRPVLSFASYTQSIEGLRVTRTGNSAEYSFEYSSRQRAYSRRFLTPSERQSDMMHSFALGAWRRAGKRTAVGLLAEYRWNLSNNAAYRYREPSLSGYLTWALPHGFRIEVGERLAALDFSRRAVSNDPLRNRSDVLATTMLGVSKSLAEDVALTGRYYYEKDFSNEPLRRFSDHRFLLGLRISVGRPSRRPQSASVAGELPAEGAREIANLGYRALMKRDYSEALRLSQRAFVLDPSLAEAHTNAGIAYYKMGRRKEAIAQWRQTIALQPDNARVRQLLKEADLQE